MILNVSNSLIIPQPKPSALPQCLSHDAMAKYHTRFGPERAVDQKLTAMVLQQSFWPFFFTQSAGCPSHYPCPVRPPSLPFFLCCVLTCAKDAKRAGGFAAFYNDKHQGHNIEWIHALDTSSLRTRFVAGPKELSETLYQAIVLRPFNDMTTWRKFHFMMMKLHRSISWLCRLPVLVYAFLTECWIPLPL
jgi:Cullin family